jgi:bifunctional non-homologous end joining protein LigD
VFDVLWLDGKDLTSLPLEERRRILDRMTLRAPLHRIEAIDHPEPWELARERGWEGVIAKRLDSPYEQKRSKHWLKMKCELAQEFVVGGFTDPQGGRVGLGALLVGYYEGDDLVFAGKVGTGLDTKLLTNLRARLDASAIEKTPFTKATGLPRVRQHWVKPEIVVNVAFIEWTGHGKLRHSRLLAVVDGKNPRDVVKQT